MKPKKIERIMKKMLVYSLSQSLVIVLFPLVVSAEMRMATTRFVLKGQSSGGELILTPVPEPFARHPHFVVTNSPGENAATVLDRLTRSIVDIGYVSGGGEALKNGDGLVLPLGDVLWRNGKLIEAPVWIIGGNDQGFNIPPAPLFLSAACESNRVILRWVNATTYDVLWVFGGVAMTRAIEMLAGNAERYECDNTKLFPSGYHWPEGTNILLAVVGVKDGVPSTASAIKIVNFNRQEPVINVPFSHGVVPGFRFWAHSPTGAKVECRQGILHPPPLGGGTEIWRLKYYQVFKGTGAGQAGLYRRWLGLKPGHEYRVSARLNKLYAEGRNLPVTLHAIQLPANGKDLTPKQLAGEEALPDGRKGKSAGQLARYDATGSMNGQQTEMSSGMSLSETVAGEITLSGDSDSIAVWFRAQCEDAQEVAVGLDWLAIEDLGKK